MILLFRGVEMGLVGWGGSSWVELALFEINKLKSIPMRLIGSG